MLILHFNEFVWSNPGEKVLKCKRTMGQISLLLSTKMWTLSLELDDNISLIYISKPFLNNLDICGFFGK